MVQPYTETVLIYRLLGGGVSYRAICGVDRNIQMKVQGYGMLPVLSGVGMHQGASSL